MILHLSAPSLINKLQGVRSARTGRSYTPRNSHWNIVKPCDEAFPLEKNFDPASKEPLDRCHLPGRRLAMICGDRKSTKSHPMSPFYQKLPISMPHCIAYRYSQTKPSTFYPLYHLRVHVGLSIDHHRLKSTQQRQLPAVARGRRWPAS